LLGYLVLAHVEQGLEVPCLVHGAAQLHNGLQALEAGVVIRLNVLNGDVGEAQGVIKVGILTLGGGAGDG